jgi:hypothetical protein
MQYIHAVTILFDHPLNTGNTLDSSERLFPHLIIRLLYIYPVRVYATKNVMTKN